MIHVESLPEDIDDDCEGFDVTVVVSITMHGVPHQVVHVPGAMKQLEDRLTLIADGWQQQEARNSMHAQVYVGVRPE